MGSPEGDAPVSSGPGAESESDQLHQAPEFIDLVSSSDEGNSKPACESPRSEGAYYSNNSINAYLHSAPIPPVVRQIPAPESSEAPCFRALHYGCSLENASTIEAHATSSDWLDMGAQLLGEVAAINNRVVASCRAREEEERRLKARRDALNTEIHQIRCRCVISESSTAVLNSGIRELKEGIAHYYELSAEERQCSEGVEQMIRSVEALKPGLYGRILEAEGKADWWEQRDLFKERTRRLELARNKLRKALDLDDVEHLF